MNNPRHEFNFWFDPEAAAIVLRAPWKKIVCTPTDISVKTNMTAAMVKQIEAAGTPLRATSQNSPCSHQAPTSCGTRLAAAAWIDPVDHHQQRDSLHERRYRSWAGYGNTLTWDVKDASHPNAQRVEIQFDLDTREVLSYVYETNDGPHSSVRPPHWRSAGERHTIQVCGSRAMSPIPDDLTTVKDDMVAFIEGHGMRRFHGYVDYRGGPMRHVGNGRQSRRLEGFC